MDVKVTFDWRARPLYILSVIDHQRRRLVHCRSTYHPTSDWVAQQMREAFPFDEAPAMMLMDHDSIFLPIIKNTLPAMGVRVIRTAVGCPRQNGTIERFNRTLTEELLDHVIPLNSKHLNGLLAEYQRFYNTARPHQANKGQAPEHQVAANDTAFAPGMLRAEAIPWLGGLHQATAGRPDPLDQYPLMVIGAGSRGPRTPRHPKTDVFADTVDRVTWNHSHL
jgi:hypothetical protein